MDIAAAAMHMSCKNPCVAARMQSTICMSKKGHGCDFRNGKWRLCLPVRARVQPNDALRIEAQRTRVLAYAHLAQLLQEQVARQHDFVLVFHDRVRIEAVEGAAFGRKFEWFGAEIESTLLE